MAIFGEISKLCEVVCALVFTRRQKKDKKYKFSINDAAFAVTGVEFTAKDTEFSVNARDV